MPREICVCGHTDENHVERIHGTGRITMVFASGHGMCMKCDCAQFTWVGWTPEFEEELKKGKEEEE